MIKQQKCGNAQGNAMVYILIAVALFGALTLTLSRQNETADGQDISDEQLTLYTLELMEYVASAQQVIDQMIFTGSEISDLNFVTPDDAAFNTPPHQHKVFHPQGGGLNYQETFNSNLQVDNASAWHIMQGTNVEWTRTTGHDVILSALRIPENICSQLNKEITGSLTIPDIGASLDTYFVDAAPKADLLNANCPSCDGYFSLCVRNPSGPTYGFYNIIAAQ